MSKQNIVEQYISSSFQADNYYDFLEEIFLVEDFLGDDIDTEDMSQDIIYHVASLELEDKKIRCIALKVKSLDARAHQRDLFVRYAKDATTPIDAIVAAIITDDLESHRLSLITFDPDEHALKPIPSSYKRFSYRLGVDEVSKTTRQRLKEELLKQKITLAHLKEVFSVEKVSKVFFDKYRALYINIFNDDSVVAVYKDETERDKFAKNLLGRIVFLYFLQKKGWLGVEENKEWGSGSKHFIRILFNEYKGNDFYGERLYPLFFEALNTDRRENNDWFNTLHCKVPFLNGGLFDANNDVDEKSRSLILDNKIFKNIFELFDAYNFTVMEDIPHDSEVAVDPEMLGRVFENLLDSDYRQEHGAFYTPREIVHHMCQHSLVEFLANDFDINEIKSLVLEQITDTNYIRNHAKDIETKLKKVKILDPAIGSGAFPMGLLHEVVSVLANLNKSLNTPSDLYNIKKEVIEKCIHGIDIDGSAVDIAKLRFWLSMVVDASAPEPLPNLFFKIMQGNSLLETVDGIDPVPAEISEPKTKKEQKNLINPIQQAWDFDKVDAQDHILVLTKKLHQFFMPDNRIKKDTLLKDIFSIIRAILDQRIGELERRILELKNLRTIEYEKTMSPAVEKKIEKISLQIYQNELIIVKIQKLQDEPIGRTIFMYKLWFGEILKEGGFDIVIANPPYIKEYTDKDAFNGTRDLSCYQGKMDIWYLFACLGINLLKDDTGILTYIATNNWITNAGASLFRNKVLEETQVLEFIDFGDYKVFDSAGIQTMIMMLKKTTDNEEYFTEYSKVIDKNISKMELEKFLHKERSKKFDIFKAKITKKDLMNESINFLKQNIFNVLLDLDNSRNFTLKENEVAQGIVGAPDKAFIVKDDEYDNFTNEEKLYLKKFYTNAGRYKENSSEKYIFYITDNNLKGKQISDFPNIEKHFEEYKNELIDAKVRYKTPNKPYYYLHRERDEIFFMKGNKIICATRTIAPSCTYTEDEFYGSRALNFIKTDRINLKYLTSILNSKMAHYWLKYKGKLTGDLLQIDKSQLLSVPIKKTDNIKPFEMIVDCIILLKGEDNEKYEFEIEFFERLIDIMVYELYFEKEIYDQGYGLMQLIENKCIENISLEQVLKLYRQWSDRNHKVAYNVAFIDSLELIQTIETNI